MPGVRQGPKVPGSPRLGSSVLQTALTPLFLVGDSCENQSERGEEDFQHPGSSHCGRGALGNEASFSTGERRLSLREGDFCDSPKIRESLILKQSKYTDGRDFSERDAQRCVIGAGTPRRGVNLWRHLTSPDLTHS